MPAINQGFSLPVTENRYARRVLARRMTGETTGAIESCATVEPEMTFAIHGLGTAVPLHAMSQIEAADLAARFVAPTMNKPGF